MNEELQNTLQKTRDEVEKVMGVVMGQVHGLPLTPSTLQAARVGFVNELIHLQSQGVLPSGINMTPVQVAVSTEVTGQVDVGLPWFLRAYLQEGPLYEIPIFDHDCNRCVFLAHIIKHDLYFCKAPMPMPTLIARYGHEAKDYTSGMEFGRTGKIEELEIAFNLAREKGFIDDHGSPCD